MPEKLRVLFHCKDNPWWTDSGYSIGARYLIQGLWNDIDLAVFAPVGTRYKMQYYFPDLGFMGFERDYTLVLPDKTEITAGDPIPVYPGLTEGYGEDIVEEHFQNFHAEILWQVADAWALSRIPELAKQDRVRWVLQLPVDFMEPFPQYLLDRLKPAMRLVPWVQDGKERLEKAGLKNVADPIPFGINPEIWKPQDRSKNPSTMASFGFRYDTFNISIVAANQYQRKAWEQTIKAIKLFREKRPDVPIRLYLHTHLNTADGWDITALITHYGLSDVTSTARPYEMAMGMYSEHQIMQAHALADVVMNPGLEGFGLSTIQAQACFPAGTQVRFDGPQGAMKRDYSGWVYEIETANGLKCMVTEEHPFLTPAGWVKAKQLNNGGLLYVSRDYGIQNLDGGAIEEVTQQLRKSLNQGTSSSYGAFEGGGSRKDERTRFEEEDWKHSQIQGSQPNRARHGLHRRSRRWGGNGDDQEGHGAQGSGRVPSVHPHLKHIERTHGLVGTEAQLPECLHSKTEDSGRDSNVHLQYTRDVILQVLPRIGALSDNQEAPHESYASLDREQVQSIKLRRLLDLPNGTYQSNPMVECEAIKTITRRYAQHITVYNLKTKDGIYFANGFLVHNCGTPVIGLNAAATKDLLEAGVLVPVYNEMLTQALINRVEPHSLHIAQALEKIYETPRSAFSKGVDFVHSNFTWDIVNAKWRKLFEEVDAELEARCIKSRRYPPAPSEEASRIAAQRIELA